MTACQSDSVQLITHLDQICLSTCQCTHRSNLNQSDRPTNRTLLIMFLVTTLVWKGAHVCTLQQPLTLVRKRHVCVYHSLIHIKQKQKVPGGGGGGQSKSERIIKYKFMLICNKCSCRPTCTFQNIKILLLNFISISLSKCPLIEGYNEVK